MAAYGMRAEPKRTQASRLIVCKLVVLRRGLTELQVSDESLVFFGKFPSAKFYHFKHVKPQTDTNLNPGQDRKQSYQATNTVQEPSWARPRGSFLVCCADDANQGGRLQLY